MDTITHELETDLLLVKRTAAQAYTRKRWALRKLVELGVFTPEQARSKRVIIVNLQQNWRAARALLKG